MTNDVDVVVFLRATDIERLPELFPQAEFYLPPVSVIATEVARERRGHFNIIHIESNFKADIYPTGRDELNAWGFRNQRAVSFDGEPIQMAPPEYVIVRKLEFFREGGSEKHLRDIRAMLQVQGAQIDQASLAEWIRIRGVEAQWKMVTP